MKRIYPEKRKIYVNAAWQITLCLLAGWLFITPLARAQDKEAAQGSQTSSQENVKLDDVIVTAEKRAANVQDIPASITALDATLIEDAKIEDLADIATFTPGLEFRNAGSRRHSFTFMRGIKNVHSQQPAMGYYVDGVSYSKSYMFDFPLLDVERIEVLKGPQGTLYGRNSMAGVINVITAQPGNETKGKISAGLGSDDLLQFQGSVQAPLVKDKLFFSVSAQHKSQDGYMENDYDAAGDEGRHTEGQAGRIKLKAVPNEDLDITLNLDAQTWDEGVFPLRLTSRNSLVASGKIEANDDYHYAHDFEGDGQTDFWGTSLNVNYRFAFGTLTSITGYNDYSVDEFFDSDMTSYDFTRMNYIQDDKNFSQELRLASSDSDSPLQWLTGVYFFQNDSDNRSTVYYGTAMAASPSNPFRGGTGNTLTASDSTNKGAALFGQASYLFNKKFELTLGLRSEYEEAKMDWRTVNSADSGATVATDYPSQSEDYTAFLPKASLSYHLDDAHMVYFTFAGGNRSGGFNKLSVDYDTSYDQETSWLYEIGTKNSFLNRKMTLNISVFYTDIDDEQFYQYDPDINSYYVTNAGKSHRMGVEAEIYYTPVPGLDFNAGLTLLEAEYDEYCDTKTGTDYDGNQVFNVPEVSGNVGVQYRMPLFGQWNLMGRLDASFIGKRYFDDGNTVSEDAYTLVNAKIGVEGKNLDIYLWADNLLDEHYVVFENTTKGVAEDGAPVTAGVTVSYRF